MRSNALVALLAAALGCTHTAPPSATPTVQLGQRFTLRSGGSAAIAGTPAKISFERILSDSRCAIDVTCIRAGEASAWFRLEAERGRSDTLTLDSDRNTTGVAGGYRVTLLSVSPAPRSTVRIDPRDYVVEISVSLE